MASPEPAGDDAGDERQDAPVEGEALEHFVLQRVDAAYGGASNLTVLANHLLHVVDAHVCPSRLRLEHDKAGFESGNPDLVVGQPLLELDDALLDVGRVVEPLLHELHQRVDFGVELDELRVDAVAHGDFDDHEPIVRLDKTLVERPVRILLFGHVDRPLSRD